MNWNKPRRMVGRLFRARCTPLLIRILPCLLASIFAVQAQEVPTKHTNFDSSPWIEDFHQLLHALATHYANLEWAVNDRHMDLPALVQKTENAIQNAGSDTDARSTIQT